jgi:AcrR family transcriptional regulator
MADPKLSLRERKKQKNRARILEVARDLFQSQGFDATSIEQIAQEAEISRGTFFNYFATKETLLGAIADEELAWLQHRVEFDLAPIPSAVAKIRRTMRMFVDDTLPFLQVARYVFLDALQHPTGEESTSIRLGEILRRLVVEAQSSGEIRADLDPVEISHAITGAYMAALFSWVALPRPPTPTTMPMVENIVDMLFEGIAGPQYRSPVQPPLPEVETLWDDDNSKGAQPC